MIAISISVIVGSPSVIAGDVAPVTAVFPSDMKQLTINECPIVSAKNLAKGVIRLFVIVACILEISILIIQDINITIDIVNIKSKNANFARGINHIHIASFNINISPQNILLFLTTRSYMFPPLFVKLPSLALA